MNAQHVRAVVLNLVTDDYYGLWEVIWRLKEMCPTDSEVELRAKAETAISHLIRDGNVAMFWRETATSEPIRVTEDITNILAKSENWNEPNLTTEGTMWIASV